MRNRPLAAAGAAPASAATRGQRPRRAAQRTRAERGKGACTPIAHCSAEGQRIKIFRGAECVGAQSRASGNGDSEKAPACAGLASGPPHGAPAGGGPRPSPRLRHGALGGGRNQSSSSREAKVGAWRVTRACCGVQRDVAGCRKAHTETEDERGLRSAANSHQGNRDLQQ